MKTLQLKSQTAQNHLAAGDKHGCHMVHQDVRVYLLGAVDDEITSGVQRTLVELTKVSVCQATQ